MFLLPYTYMQVTAHRLRVEMNFHAVTKSLLKQTDLQRDLSRFREAYQQDDSSSCEGFIFFFL